MRSGLVLCAALLLIRGPCAADLANDYLGPAIERGVGQSVLRLQDATAPETGELSRIVQAVVNAVGESDDHLPPDVASDLRTRQALLVLALVPVLASEDTTTRRAAAVALRSIAGWWREPLAQPKELYEAAVWLLAACALDDDPQVQMPAIDGLGRALEARRTYAWVSDNISASAAETCVALLYHRARSAEGSVREHARGALYAARTGPLPPTWDYSLVLDLLPRGAASGEPVPAVVALAHQGAQSVRLMPWEVVVTLVSADGATLETVLGPPPTRPRPEDERVELGGAEVTLTPLWEYETESAEAWLVPDVVGEHAPLAPGRYAVRGRVTLREHYREDDEVVWREGRTPTAWGSIGSVLVEFSVESAPAELTVW